MKRAKIPELVLADSEVPPLDFGKSQLTCLTKVTSWTLRSWFPQKFIKQKKEKFN